MTDYSESSLPSSTTLAVLAGGQGARMGSPKANLRVNNQPILTYLLKRWNWPGPTLLVTAPGTEHPAGCEEFDAEVTDPLPAAGPLRGLLTAFEHLSTPNLIITPVDMPCIESHQFDWLLTALSQSPGALGLMCQRDDEPEPFPSVYRRAARSLIQSHFQTGQRSLRSLLKNAAFIAVSPPSWPAAVWTNLNTPADFDSFKSLQHEQAP